MFLVLARITKKLAFCDTLLRHRSRDRLLTLQVSYAAENGRFHYQKSLLSLLVPRLIYFCVLAVVRRASPDHIFQLFSSLAGTGYYSGFVLVPRLCCAAKTNTFGLVEFKCLQFSGHD